MLKFFGLPILLTCIIAVSTTYLCLRKRIPHRLFMLSLLLVVVWLGFFSVSLAEQIPYPENAVELITLTATGEKNPASKAPYIFLSSLNVGNEKDTTPTAERGCWPAIPQDGTDENFYVWAPEGDELLTEKATDSVVFPLRLGLNRSITLRTCGWSGIIIATLPDGSAATIDTYSETDTEQTFSLPASSTAVMRAASQRQILAFWGFYFAFTGLIICVFWFVTKKKRMQKLYNYGFLFEQLVHRDFTQKYKRTILGMVWSILAPLMNLLIMWFVFQNLFGASADHYVIYLFAGNLVYGYFSDATGQGMSALLANSGIFTKVNVPKYLFLMSQSVSCFINFMLTLIIFFIFVALEGLSFTANFMLLIFPIVCLVVFNLGVALILSALYVFFRDMSYLWGIISQLIMWLSAIFYTIDSYSTAVKCVFYMNPVYLYITYFRDIVIQGTVPSIGFHLLSAAYALIMLLIGSYIYKRYNHEFLYYV